MALSSGITATGVVRNKNFLSPLGFRFLLSRAPNVEYFCQSAALPSLSMGEALQPTPFVTIPRPGDKLVYELFSLRFRVDEDLTNYLEIHDWMVGLTHPENFDQYRTLESKVSDGSIIILTSNNNASIRVAFTSMFPTSLSSLPFDITGSDIEYLEAEVSFRYRNFTIETL